MSPAPVVLEEQIALPVLIIDKDGTVSDGIVKSLAASLKVVIASSKKIILPRVISISYVRSLPKIPNSKFSAIIVVSRGQKDLVSFLPELSEKARECQVPLIYLTSIYGFSKAALSALQKIPFLQLVLLGDIPGTGESRLDVLIHEAKSKGRILLPDTGLITHYPTPYPLLVEHVIALAFSPVNAFVYEPICLFSKTPTTEIAYARIIQHALPHIKIDFTKKMPQMHQSYVPEKATHLSYDSSVLGNWIKIVYADSSTPKSNLSTRKSQTAQRNIKYIVTFAIILFFAPLIVSFVTAFYGKYQLESIPKQVEAGNIKTAYKNSQQSQTAFMIASDAMLVYQPFQSVLTRQYQTYMSMLQVGGDISIALQHITHSGILFQTSVKSEVQPGDKTMFVTGVNEAGEALLVLQKLLAQSDLPGSVKTRLMPYKQTIGYLTSIREVLPELLGFNGEKTYLVLLQNNTELRPGGGFIGSFALVKVDRGELMDMKIYDVYDADGQLQGMVNPPFFLSRYMGASHWYLRDSNASVLFAQNGAQALFFLDKEMGVKADGVIGINAKVIQDVMEKIGGITIPEFNQTITAQNVIELTQDHAEKNFFPGSTQKKDFLNAFQKALFTKIQTNHSLLLPLVALLGSEVQQKTIQTYSPQENLEDVFVSAGSGGGVPMVNHNAKELDDLFGLNEANIGQNKTNKYLQRKVEHQIKLNEKGEVAESVSTTYTNTSTKTSSYGGDYISYLRFILPKNASIVSVQIDGKDQSITPAITDIATYTKKNFLPPVQLEVETEVFDMFQTVGMPFIVPQGTTKKITLSYTFQTEPPAPDYTYVRNIIKQSGTGADDYSLTMILPDGYLVSSTNLDNGQQIGQMLQAKGTLETDAHISLHLVKKLSE
jgi:hypothetical protein